MSGEGVEQNPARAAGYYRGAAEAGHAEARFRLSRLYARGLGVEQDESLAEQLLHYYCDRCLFRFRDAGVRRKVAPLLL